MRKKGMRQFQAKVISCAMAGMLAVSLLAGCGKTPAGNAGETESAEVGSTEAALEAAKDEQKTPAHSNSGKSKTVADSREELNGKKVGAGNPSKVQTDKSYKKSVRVSTVEEFYEAFGSDTQIILEEGRYNFSDLQEEYYLPTRLDNDEIGGFYAAAYPLLRENHVKIQGEGNVEIVIEDAYVAAISIMGCDEIELENLTIGHAVEPGYCSGSVIMANKTTNLTVRECDLYGSGTYGLEAEDSSIITLEDSIIHDCTYGIMALYRGYYVNVNNCILRDSIGIGNIFNFVDTSVVRYKDCEISGNNVDDTWTDLSELPLVRSDTSDGVLFKRCVFKNNYYGMTSKGPGVVFEDCNFDEDGGGAGTRQSTDLGTFDRRSGAACDVADLVGRWILTEGEVEGDHWYASNEDVQGEIVIAQENGEVVLQSFEQTWNGGSAYEKLEKSSLKKVTAAIYTGCGNNAWRAEVETDTVLNSAEGRHKLDPEYDGYALTLVDENTLLWQTFFEFDGGPGVSYLTFHRAGMVGNNDEGWYTVSECAPIRKRIDEAPDNARFLVVAGAETEGISMLGMEREEYGEEYLFINLMEDPYYLLTEGLNCSYNEEKEDFDYSLYAWQDVEDLEDITIAGNTGVKGLFYNPPEGIPAQAAVFINVENGEKFFWPIYWMTGRQAGACLYITDDVLYSKKMEILDMTKPADTEFAGYLYAYPEEDYETEPGLPLRN